MKNSAWFKGTRPGTRAGSLGLGLMALLASSADVLAQCSMCRDAVAASPTQTREAMNYAIIGLAFAPYGVAAFAVWTLSPAVRERVRAGWRRLSLRRRDGTS